MRRMLILMACASVLAACGQGGAGGGAGPDAAAASNPACALITNAAATFGADADIVGYEGPAPIAAHCEITSANGARSGEVLLFTPQSLGAVTAQAQLAEVVQNWDASTDTPLEAVQFGDEAQLAKDLPGYQTQIVIRVGDRVIAVRGASGDDAMNGDRIASALAMQVVAPSAQ